MWWCDGVNVMVVVVCSVVCSVGDGVYGFCGEVCLVACDGVYDFCDWWCVVKSE